MKSPKDMRIIQIDITNACVHECSNCTRFCGHHKKPYFMELDFIKKAIDSLDDYVGTVGIMGGEPTLHPNFEEIAKYIASKYPKNKIANNHMLKPQKRFMKAVQEVQTSSTFYYNSGNNTRPTINAPGLWSVMGKGYKKHYELIQDTFQFQVLNDHVNKSYHDPILVTRKELNIPDDEWFKLRDKCWIQNTWSASITPKGAFFCEVAGTLDMLFNGPGGWEIEPNWWKRDVCEFKEQLQWCELCSVALETFTRDANEEIDDVSPIIYNKLVEVKSRKLKNGKVNKLEIENGIISKNSKATGERFSGNMPYTESYDAKFSANNSVLYPDGFEAICFINNNLDNKEKEKLINSFENQFDYVFFVFKNTQIQEGFTFSDDLDSNKSYNVENHSFEYIINDILNQKRPFHYIATFTDELLPKEDFTNRMRNHIFNPGTLIYGENNEDSILNNWVNDNNDHANYSEFVFFSRNASSIKDLNNNFSHLKSFNDLKLNWKTEKKLPFDKNLFFKTMHDTIDLNKRYVMYSAGAKAVSDMAYIKENNGKLVYVVDSNIEKHGKEFEGFIVQNPGILLSKKDEFDYIAIATINFYNEIKENLLKLGFLEEQIVFF